MSLTSVTTESQPSSESTTRISARSKHVQRQDLRARSEVHFRRRENVAAARNSSRNSSSSSTAAIR